MEALRVTPVDTQLHPHLNQNPFPMANRDAFAQTLQQVMHRAAHPTKGKFHEDPHPRVHVPRY